MLRVEAVDEIERWLRQLATLLGDVVTVLSADEARQDEKDREGTGALWCGWRE